MRNKIIGIGQKIQQLRKEKGWTQDQLAEIIKIDSKQISKYERDLAIPSTEIIVELALAFNISTDYLLIDESIKIPMEYKNNTEFLIEINKKINEMEELSEFEKNAIIVFIDALIAKYKLKKLASSIK